MRPNRAFSILAIFFSLLLLGSCSGGSKAPSEGSGSSPEQADNGDVPKTLQPEAVSEAGGKDKLGVYAAAIGRDVGEVEKTYNDTLGTSAGTFNDAWLKFFMATDPALANLDTYLPVLWAQAFSASMTHGELTRSVVHGDAGDQNWISIKYPDGSYYGYQLNQGWYATTNPDGTVTSGTTSEDPQAAARAEATAKDRGAVLGFNSLLLMLQSRLARHGEIFGLSVEKAAAGSFAVPDSFYGPIENLDPEFKDLLVKPLYSASLKANGEFFSFFQFAADAPLDYDSEHRFLSGVFAKLTWIPAATNVLAKP